MKSSLDFVVATSFQADKKGKSKTWAAILCFAFAIILARTDHLISMAFITARLQ
jgi:hypothetical protein